MKKRTIYGVIVALVAVGLLALYWNSDNQKDRRVWGRFQKELTADLVASVEVSAAKTAALSEAEKNEVVRLLRAAQFDKSNRVGHGPTPVGILTLKFADGRVQHVSIHGTESFELSPRHLDDGTQFFIRSKELGAWLKKRFQGPAVG